MIRMLKTDSNPVDSQYMTNSITPICGAYYHQYGPGHDICACGAHNLNSGAITLKGTEDSVALSQGTKLDAGKARMDLLSPVAITALSEVLTKGAIKYADNNWRKGIKWSRVLAASLRHILAYMGGQDKDPETGLSHLAHAMCCMMFLLEYEVTHKALDDRYKGEKI